MSDFHQRGLITTLHRFGPVHPGLTEELRTFNRTQPLVLLLPCHASDLNGEAVKTIVAALQQINYLTGIIVSMNGVPEADQSSVRSFWETAGKCVTVLFNDSPENAARLSAKAGFSVENGGKGLNLWAALLEACREYETATVVVHDCDIVTYTPELPARLAYAAANPEFGVVFAKGYYSRVKERFYGRVTRLFLGPLTRSLIHVAGHQPLLDFLDCFRYPLAGEFAGDINVVGAMPVAAGWRLEIAALCELFRMIDPRHICQVDLCIDYEHKHRPLRSDGTAFGLEGMCVEIASELLSQVRAEGTEVSPKMLESLCSRYERSAGETIQRYEMDARINGLSFEKERECEAVEVFSAALRRTSEEYQRGNQRPPYFPPAGN